MGDHRRRARVGDKPFGIMWGRLLGADAADKGSNVTPRRKNLAHSLDMYDITPL